MPFVVSLRGDCISAHDHISPPPPGSRVEIRDAEWIVRRVDRVAPLPTRDKYTDGITVLLEGENQKSVSDTPLGNRFTTSVSEDAVLELFERYGNVKVTELRSVHPRLPVERQISQSQHFLHWETESTDPRFLLSSMSASDLTKERAKTLDKYGLRLRYLDEFSAAEATQNFLNAVQNYPLLKRMQTNLYKCFLPQSWMVLHSHGVAGFLHPEGVYDDPKGGKLRAELYPKLRSHFQFANELMLFSDVDHHTKFSVNIASNTANESFDHIANLFHPQTIDACYEHDGSGEVPGIKDDENSWSVAGHRGRIIHTSANELQLFSSLYDSEGTAPLEARLPALHAEVLVHVLRKIAEYPVKLSSLNGKYFSIEMWHETNAQKDRTIKRETRFPNSIQELIYSGPHIFVANPLYKTPRQECKLSSDYVVCDLQSLSEDYLPRTSYVPACSASEYLARAPKLPWDTNRSVLDEYRIAYRRMLGLTLERTAIAALIPPEIGHINTVISVAFQSSKDMILVAGMMSSIILDFYVKTTGRGDLYASILENTPIPVDPINRAIIISRILRLNCLTRCYVDLWERNWESSYEALESQEIRASLSYSELGPRWKPEYAIRSGYDRRQAQFEIDVALAKELGISMDELNTIYRIQFPVLRQYEQDTWYDQHGRIVFTISKGLPGVGLDRKTWEEVKPMPSGIVEKTFEDDTMPGGTVPRTITYVAPWGRFEERNDTKSVCSVTP